MSSEGYGHTTGAYGGYGENLTGYGDPWSVLGAYVLLPAGAVVPDDGGILVTLGGTFTEGQPYGVTIDGIACRAGVPGRGGDCYPLAGGASLRFVLPPLSVGAHSVVIGGPGGSPRRSPGP
jgi:hypothetical protein